MEPPITYHYEVVIKHRCNSESCWERTDYSTDSRTAEQLADQARCALAGDDCEVKVRRLKNPVVVG
jgi:hypothetical protein